MRPISSLLVIAKRSYSWLILLNLPMDGQGNRSELSMEDLLGQLGDFSEYNDLKQKVSQIEKSKVYI